MEKLRKFKPVIAMCSQGQKRSGVEEGGLYMYNNIFRDVCDSKPNMVQHQQFNTQNGYQRLYDTCKRLTQPLILGGDHSVSSSSVMASNQKYRDLHVIWIDAHPDIHTYNSTESGNTHGTPLSVCTGLERQHWASRMSLRNLPFENLTYVGIRDIDEWEAKVIKEQNIRHLTVGQTIDFIRKLNKPIHISFDIDALDPELVSSTGTRVENGLHPHEVEEMIKEALEADQLVSLDVVEFNELLGNPKHSVASVKQVFKELFRDEEEPVDFIV